MRAHVIVDTHTGEISVEGYELHQIHPDCADCRAALERGDHPLFLLPDDLNDEVTIRDIPVDDDLAQLLRDELEEASLRMRPRWRTSRRRRR